MKRAERRVLRTTRRVSIALETRWFGNLEWTLGGWSPLTGGGSPSHNSSGKLPTAVPGTVRSLTLPFNPQSLTRVNVHDFRSPSRD